MNQTTHALDYYREQELAVFPTIPGMKELLMANEATLPEVERKYPDAVFALMTANDIMAGDRERNAITQEAYFDILRGKKISDVRRRHDQAVEKYLQDHMWDD